MVTLLQLTYIVAVDNYRHFATAAANCYVTQPTLSTSIQKMEEELGVLIFDRTQQPVVPTEIGKSVIAQARKILAETSRINDIVSMHKNDVSGEFRVGVIPTVAPYLLPLFLESFISRYPRLDLVIDEIQTHQIIDKLRKDEIDVGIMATPLFKEDLIEKPLYYEPFVAYISPDHPLYFKEKLAPGDISAGEVLLLQEGHCFRGHALQLCRDSKANQDAPRHLRFEGGNFDTLKKLVEKNLGITLLPYLSAREMEGTEKHLMVREFENPVPKREISLVYMRAYLKKHIIDALGQEILSSISVSLRSSEDSLIVT